MNENAFAFIVQARPCPTFGRPVHFGVAPIDYSPVLLLMPFRFHLAMDTLPSGNRKRWLQVRLGRVQLSPSCPFRLLHTCLSPGPRGITPALDMALLIRAPEGLQPSRSTRCSAHTTKLYDRREEEISLDEVERIAI